MNIQCIALSILTDDGPTPIRVYPETLTKKKMLEIASKALSTDSYEGQIITGTISNQIFASYTFFSNLEHQAVMTSLVIIFKKQTLDLDKIQKSLLIFLKDYRDKQGRDLKAITDNLPNLYQDMQPIYMKFNSTSTYVVSVEPIRKEKKKEEDQMFASFKEELWGEEAVKEDEVEELEEEKNGDSKENEYHDVKID